MDAIQLSIWDALDDAKVTPVAADFLGLLVRLETDIAPLPTTQKLTVAGEAILRLGEIYSIRAGAKFEEIEYLGDRHKEPILPLDAFEGYIRRSMAVDLGQFIESPELPEVDKNYQRTVVRELSVPELLAEIEVAEVATVDIDHVYAEILELAHAEPIEEWAERIRSVMGDVGVMTFRELVERSGLSIVDGWLSLLLGDTGCQLRSIGDFYDVRGIEVVNSSK
jgi:hypothetical protein